MTSSTLFRALLTLVVRMIAVPLPCLLTELVGNGLLPLEV